MQHWAETALRPAPYLPRNHALGPCCSLRHQHPSLQVCGAVAPEVLSNGRFKILGHKGAKNLRVGRLDSVRPAPPEKLPAEHADLAAFAGFWKARGFSMEEAMALMGSHALVDEQVRACGMCVSMA